MNFIVKYLFRAKGHKFFLQAAPVNPEDLDLYFLRCPTQIISCLSAERICHCVFLIVTISHLLRSKRAPRWAFAINGSCYFLKRSSSLFLASSFSSAEDEAGLALNIKKSQKFALSRVLWNSDFGSRHLLWEDSEKNLQFRQICRSPPHAGQVAFLGKCLSPVISFLHKAHVIFSTSGNVQMNNYIPVV